MYFPVRHCGYKVDEQQYEGENYQKMDPGPDINGKAEEPKHYQKYRDQPEN
jgi:hypothetical protein